MRIGVLLVMGSSLASLAACERKPVFDQPPALKGGFVVNCVAVTDFQKRIAPCNPALTPLFHNNTGGCSCAQGADPQTATAVRFSLPPISMGEAAGVVSFVDPSCTTTVASTCLPRVIPTTAAYDEFDAPPGQIRVDSLFERIPDTLLQPTRLDMRNGTTDLEVGRIAAGDVRDEIRRGCNLAHYGFLAQALTGFIRPSLRWQEALTQVNVEYNPHTTFLDGEDFRLGGWGWLADLRRPLDQQIPPFPDVPFRAFATHVYRPTGSTGPTICQEGLQHPFGIASVLGFTQTGGIGNQPPQQSNLSARLPERHQVVLSIGSSAILTIKGVATRTLGLHGAIEVELSGCNSDGCTARLGGFRLGTSRFIIEGHDVRLFEITNGAATGVLKGDSLVFPEFSGDVNAQLSDGRYAQFPVKSGVLLARWEPDSSRFVMAFSFDTKTAEGDEVTLNGTAFGTFSNTSPTAKIQIVSPVGSVTANRSTIECTSPAGATVELDATSSADREDPALRFAWHTPDMPMMTTNTTLSLVDLALGEHEVQLMAYDSRGFAGYDPLTLEVVDSQPPVISQQDLCIFPPNHRAVLLRLGRELPVTATDRCDGDASASLSITNATASNGGPGVLSWDGNSVCVVVERDGDEPERLYEVQTSALDSNGNRSFATMRVRIPHNGPTSNCARPQTLQPCGGTP